MANTDLQLKAIDSLVQIHASIKKAQHHQPVDSTITNSIERIYLHLAEILRQEAPLAFAQLEKKALLREKLVNQREDDTVRISDLPDILLGLGIKNISVDKDWEKEELHICINLLAKNPKTVAGEVGLPKLVLENETAQIVPDNNVYVKMEKDQIIVSDLDIAERQISESIAEMQKVFTRMNAMDGAIESRPTEEKKDMIKILSGQVADWIEKEPAATPAYKIICHSLQTLLQGFITYRYFAEASSIINVFGKVNSGELKKDDEVRRVSLEVLRNLASENNINLLFKELNINEKNKTEVFQILAGFGEIIMNKLLNSLRYTSDSKERISIIHIIEEAGQRAIPAIRQKIAVDAPWYFLRNMAYILGRISKETDVEILRPLLLHKDKRVCKEAFKSVEQIGGKERGPLLLSVLPQADQELRVSIIELLGKIRYAEAVTILLDMLKNKSLIAKDEQISMQEKICTALGTIGSPEAIKTLSEIAESKSFLGIRSYPEEVKHAAKLALANIKRKQEEEQS
jgi:HEAT repeat protein